MWPVPSSWVISLISANHRTMPAIIFSKGWMTFGIMLQKSGFMQHSYWQPNFTTREPKRADVGYGFKGSTGHRCFCTGLIYKSFQKGMLCMRRIFSVAKSDLKKKKTKKLKIELLLLIV